MDILFLGNTRYIYKYMYIHNSRTVSNSCYLLIFPLCPGLSVGRMTRLLNSCTGPGNQHGNIARHKTIWQYHLGTTHKVIAFHPFLNLQVCFRLPCFPYCYTYLPSLKFYLMNTRTRARARERLKEKERENQHGHGVFQFLARVCKELWEFVISHIITLSFSPLFRINNSIY